MKAAPARIPFPAWYALGALVLAMVLSFIDRQVLNILVTPIRAEFAISDTQFSLLQGVAFALFYAVMTLPLAQLADTYSRKRLILGCIAVWSVMTMSCGLAGSFAALFLARVGVAIGEAGLSPAAISLIRDTFPRDRVATAIATYSAGIYVGGGLALIAAGPLLQFLNEAKATGTLNLFGVTEPWRIVFIVVGAAGVIGIAFSAFVREPSRRDTRTSAHSWHELIALIGSRRSYISTHLASFTAVVAIATAIPAWSPTFFMRVHGWSPARTGLVYGLAFAIAGVSGALFSGWLADRLARAGKITAALNVTRYLMLALAPISVIFPLLPDATWAIVMAACALFLASGAVALGVVPLQQIAPAHLSARITALYILVCNVIGGSLGPTIVALLTEKVFSGGTDVRFGLALFAGTSAALACWGLGNARQLMKATLGAAADLTDARSVDAIQHRPASP